MLLHAPQPAATHAAPLLLLELQRAAAKKQDPARIAAAAALTREALLGGIHYFRVRDHIEQASLAGFSRHARDRQAWSHVSDCQPPRLP